MTRIIFIVAFLLGLSVITWMGAGFIGINVLALTIISVIACVYLIGFLELTHFRAATSTLLSFLTSIPKGETLTTPELETRFCTLHPSLLQSVRLRIEGERVPLPSPVLSPYLVGLLVMLGLLGTFAGMVDTLKGAVFALEGTTELEAIRAGLAAPIKGLGLAFGTSVAGVAASAMLGLLSTLSRRDRMLATRMLDAHISTTLQTFSLSFNRQETYKALQSQAQAFPEVVSQLALLSNKIEKMGSDIGFKLVSGQEEFHQSVTLNYTNLANSVAESLRESLKESGRVTSESVIPLINDGVEAISNKLLASVSKTHDNLTSTSEAQLQSMSLQVVNVMKDARSAWTDGLMAHNKSNLHLAEALDSTLNTFNENFELKSIEALEAFERRSQLVLSTQLKDNQKHLSLSRDSLLNIQEQVNAQLEQTTTLFSKELTEITTFQKQHVDNSISQLDTLSSSLLENLASSNEASISQHEQLSDTLKRSVSEVLGSTQKTTEAILSKITDLLNASEHLVVKRVETESSWLSSYEARVNQVVTMISHELKSLVEAEQERGKHTAAQLSQLESTVASQLAVLGQALEAPMISLIETASETPKAAAEVISHLRQEISNNIERDNSLLREREEIIQSLDSLFISLEKSSVGQSDAVEKLVNSSSTILKDVGEHFTQHVESEVDKLAVISDNFSGSAVEIASLGDAFTHAVQLFNQSTGSLIENLSRIEESLNTSSSKSDEQMAYYIAQAREIIDHSMTSQQGIINQLGQITVSSKQTTMTTEVV